MKAFHLMAGLLLFAVVSSIGAVSPGEVESGASAMFQGVDRTTVTKLEIAALPNVLRLNDRVFSGGQPLGEDGFRALRRLGVRTVISVDGAKPELATAKKYGLAYVHLPHGYDGIPAQRAVELAKAVSELAGPAYIHCHHGKHRSPAAAAVACIGAGLMTPEQGRHLLQLAGTSEDYQGLHQVVARSQRVPWLDSVEVEFNEAVDVPPLAMSMARMERTFDNLLQIERAGWKAPESHPDLSPAHEALLLREHFAELIRSQQLLDRPPAFRRFIEHSHREAISLEKAMRASSMTGSARPRDRLSALLSAIGDDCKRCHGEHRD